MHVDVRMSDGLLDLMSCDNDPEEYLQGPSLASRQVFVSVSSDLLRLTPIESPPLSRLSLSSPRLRPKTSSELQANPTPQSLHLSRV